MMTLKAKVQKIVNNRTFELSMMILIIVNIIIFILQSVNRIQSQFNIYFNTIETITIFIFSIEFLLRVISLKNVKDFFKPFLILDLFVILPFYLKFLTVNLIILRIFRLSRIFRILKIARYSEVIQDFISVFKNKKEQLIVAGIFFLIALITASSLMYTVEGKVQECFSNVPKSMWWGVMTFTSVGYGDVYPKTDIGKIIASCAAVLGVILHGLIASILIAGFVEIFETKKKGNTNR